MSDNSETFEEWFELNYGRLVDSIKKRILKPCQKAWDHQAKKLEEKDKRIAELEEKLATWNHAVELRRVVQSLENQNAELREALESTVEEDCRFDHNGNCQEHGWFVLEDFDNPLDKNGNCFICWLLYVYRENKEFINYLLK